MESSFTESIVRLNLIDCVALLLIGSLIAYFSLLRQIHHLMFLLVLSAALVGTIIPVMGDIVPIIRWLIILVFFVLGMLQAKLHLSPGLLLFWGYVLCGHIFLFNSIVIQYQLQKSILLILVALIIPLLFSGKPFQSLHESLEAIASAGSIFCLLNFVSLPGFMTDPVRFSGYARGAASLAIFLGGLLPFTLWGIWKSRRWVKLLCIFGFLSGFVTLLFSGQRTGTIIGILGIIPLFLVVQNRKTIAGSIVLCTALFVIGSILYQQSSSVRKEYISYRFFNQESGLSGREYIWELALDEINTTPLLGRGSGAAELFFAPSFHNAYLEVWYNAGFFGLILFVLSQIYFLYKAARLVLIEQNRQIKIAAALALGYMIGFISMGFIESMGAGSSSINLILYLFLCFLVSNASAFCPDASPLHLSANSLVFGEHPPLSHPVTAGHPQLNKGRF